MPVGNSPRYTYHGRILGLCGLFYSPHTTNTSKRNSLGVSLEKRLTARLAGFHKSKNQDTNPPESINKYKVANYSVRHDVTFKHNNKDLRMRLWCSLCTLCLLACQVSVTVKSLCLCVTSWRTLISSLV